MRLALARMPPPWWAPAAIATIALALRVYGLADKPFWLDEVVSLRRATMPPAGLIAGSLQNNHYPTYFLLLWLVAKVGVSPWLLRLPSAIFGALAAGLVCAVGRAIDGPRTGIAAGLLLALSPFDVQYGQEARSYTLVACLILVALWGLVRLAGSPLQAARPLRLAWPPPAAWLAYCGGTAAALNVLNVAIEWFAAANLAAAAIALGLPDNGSRRAFLRNWGGAQALVVAAWLPQLAALLTATKDGLAGAAGWAPPVGLAALWAVAAPVYLQRITAFISFDLLPAAVPGLSWVILGLAGYGAWRLLRRAPAAFAVVACSAIVVPLLMVTLSISRPVLVPRYFAWSAAPFCILAGAGLGGLRGRRFAVAGGALALAGLVNLLPYYHAETKPRWDLLAARLARESHPGDVVLLNSWYARYVMRAFAEQGQLADRHLILASDPRDAAARWLPGHDLWVVFGRAGQAPLPPPEQYLKSLSFLGRPVEEVPLGRYIVLWRIAPDNGG